MADTDRSPLFDSENNQLLHTVKDLPEIGVRIPPEVMREKPLVMRVYAELVTLAKGNDGATVILPTRDEMARICDCGRRQYTEAEYRLHEIGWITIQNLEEPGRTTRRRIVVKCLQMVITDGLRMQEMSEMIKKLVRRTEAGLHKIYYRTIRSTTPEGPARVTPAVLNRLLELAGPLISLLHLDIE